MSSSDSILPQSMFVPKFIDIKPDTPRANSLETPIKGWSQNLLLRPIIVLMMFRNPARRKRLGKLIVGDVHCGQ